jgi:hypothetical protein
MALSIITFLYSKLIIGKMLKVNYSSGGGDIKLR